MAVPQRANVWLGAAAEDVGFRFELTHWTHSTEPNIDSERAKVVNDLAFTGCVNAAGLLSRTSADLVQDPKAKHPILTDGDVAAVRLNDCIHPNLMPGEGNTSASHQRGRMARALTAFRDDLVRSNIFFTTYNTLKVLAKHTEPTTMHTPPINAKSPWIGLAEPYGSKSSRAVTSWVTPWRAWLCRQKERSAQLSLGLKPILLILIRWDNPDPAIAGTLGLHPGRSQLRGSGEASPVRDVVD